MPLAGAAFAVGKAVVSQTVPRSVSVSPPSLSTVAPSVALVVSIMSTVGQMTTGAVAVAASGTSNSIMVILKKSAPERPATLT